MNKPGYLFVILSLMFVFQGKAQQTIPLYQGHIPGSTGRPGQEEFTLRQLQDTVLTKVSMPTLSIYLPDKTDKAPTKATKNRTAVIICPGGGYQALMISWEGHRVAKAFNKAGIAAFVLKYRLPNDQFMQDPSRAPLQDAQQAIKLVRKHAVEWGINPDSVGIMGFSAGGHLAASAGVHFQEALVENPGQRNDPLLFC